MTRGPAAVHAAISRWLEKGLVGEELARSLRAETDAHAAEGAGQLTRVILAATAAVVVLIAGGVFLDWAWPRMTDATRCGFLFGCGIALHVWGIAVERSGRRRPTAWFMQVAGLGLVLSSVVYSYDVWENGTAGAVLIGAGGLAAALAGVPRALRRGVFMPSAHLLFALVLLGFFLHRALDPPFDTVVWILDGVLMVVATALVLLLRGDRDGARHPWALNAFVSAVYAAGVLVVLTATGPLELENETAYALDAWLMLVAALTLWGIHRAPPGLRREWFERHLAYCLLMWVPLAFWTTLETMDGPPELALAALVLPSVAAFLYADRHRIRSLVAAAALTFIVSLWYWGSERAGALGAVAALALTGALLFWLSGRWGEGAGGAEPSGG